MTHKAETARCTAPIQEVQPRRPVKQYDLSGYVRDITLVLLLDLQDDVELMASYLIPLWDLLSNYRVNLDHAALAQQIDRDHGVPVGTQYRDAVSRWREQRKQVAKRNRPN